MHLPVFTSLQDYKRSWIRPDLIAGFTVWAVLVPEALAYATIAGVSPVIGLYAAPPALILYAAFGSSRHLVTGPMAATAALSAAAVSDLVAGGTDKFVAFTAALAIATGVIALAAGLLRLGFLANFISEPVLKGFIIGLALTIMIGQLPKLFGIEKTSGDFFEQAWGFLTHLDDTAGLTLLVGGISLALVLTLRRFAPAVPGSLLVVILGVAAVKIFNLQDHGVAIVGHIDAGLPRLGLPQHVAAADYGRLAAAAVGVMLVGFAEGLGAAKTYAARDHYDIDANRELLGLGAANAGAGLCGGMVVNGSLSKTAVNGTAGARSQLSGIVVAVLTVLTLLFLTGLFEDLPEATLAAVVIAALIELVDVNTMVKLYRVYSGRLGTIYGIAARADFIAASAALLGVLVFDTLPGLFIGIVVSALLLVYRASRPYLAVLGASPHGEWVDASRNPDAQPVSDVIVVRPEAGLFFANADSTRDAIIGLVQPTTRAVVLDAQTIPTLDVSAAEMLSTLAQELASRNIQFLVARDIGQVRDVLDHSDVADLSSQLYPTVREAIAAIENGDPGVS